MSDLDKNLENALKQQAEKLVLQPEARVWEGIEAALDQKSKRRLIGWWWSAAALVILSLGTWLLWPSQSDVTQERTQQLSTQKTPRIEQPRSQVPKERLPHSIGSDIKKTLRPSANPVVTVSQPVNMADTAYRLNKEKMPLALPFHQAQQFIVPWVKTQEIPVLSPIKLNHDGFQSPDGTQKTSTHEKLAFTHWFLFGAGTAGQGFFHVTNPNPTLAPSNPRFVAQTIDGIPFVSLSAGIGRNITPFAALTFSADWVNTGWKNSSEPVERRLTFVGFPIAFQYHHPLAKTMEWTTSFGLGYYRYLGQTAKHPVDPIPTDYLQTNQIGLNAAAGIRFNMKFGRAVTVGPEYRRFMRPCFRNDYMGTSFLSGLGIGVRYQFDAH